LVSFLQNIFETHINDFSEIYSEIKLLEGRTRTRTRRGGGGGGGQGGDGQQQ